MKAFSLCRRLHHAVARALHANQMPTPELIKQYAQFNPGQDMRKLHHYFKKGGLADHALGAVLYSAYSYVSLLQVLDLPVF